MQKLNLHITRVIALKQYCFDVLSAIDKHQESVLILLDLSAAFDTIEHGILLTRLKQCYGISGTAQRWFSLLMYL